MKSSKKPKLKSKAKSSNTPKPVKEQDHCFTSQQSEEDNLRLEQLEAELLQYEHAIAQLEQENQSLKDNTAQIKMKQKEDVETHNSQLKTVQATMSTLEAQCAAEQQNLQTSKKQLQDLTAQKSSLSSETAKLKKKLETTGVETQKLEATKLQLTQETLTLSKAIQAIQTPDVSSSFPQIEHDFLQKIEQLKQGNTTYQQQQKIDSQATQTIHTELTAAIQLHTDTQTEIQTLDTQYNEHIAQLQQKIKTTSDNIVALNADNPQLGIVLSQLQAQLGAIEQQGQQLDVTNSANYMHKLAALEALYNQVTQPINALQATLKLQEFYASSSIPHFPPYVTFHPLSTSSSPCVPYNSVPNQRPLITPAPAPAPVPTPAHHHPQHRAQQRAKRSH